MRVFEAQQINGSGEPKYSVTLLIDKTDTATIAAIKKAIAAEIKVFHEKNPKFNGKLPSTFRNPLRDGDEKLDQDGFDGFMFLNAKRNEKQGRPIVIDRHKAPITVKEDMYSGSWGVASISFYPYNTTGSTGIGVGLNGIQKVTDDDRLDGGASVNDFEDMEDENGAADLPF